MLSFLAIFTVIAVPGLAFHPLFGNSFGVPGINASYDYLVVGGGTAGLAIASRLAEDPDVSVAVLEAGSFYEVDNGNGSVIPALASLQHTSTSPNDTQPLIDWGFVSTPQTGATDRVVHYVRGKTLGGSSALNYMVYHRSTIGSYQAWADQVGDESYSFERLLPYFQKSCRLTPPDYTKRQSNATVLYDPKAFNNSLGGPLHVSWPNWASVFGTWTNKAMQMIGIPETSFDSGSLDGYSWPAATIDQSNSHRSSSQTSYLHEAMSKTALKTYTQAFAEKILFTSNKTASGVLVNTAGKRFVLTAKKEVILSAGAFQSPQLLMLSGIGPSKVLNNLSIPVLSDLPGVGQNLWDHARFTIGFRVNVDTSSRRVNDHAYAAKVALDYLNNATGPLTANGGPIVFEKLPKASREQLTNETLAALATFPSDWPEVEYLSIEAVPPAIPDPANGNNYASIAAVLVAPLSRGSVTIDSADPAHHPVINVNWLTHPADAEVAVAAFKRLRTIEQHLTNITIGPEYFPGYNVSTDAEILQFIRETVTTVWHAAGTCKMGKTGDSMAVVDSRGRVFGVNGLRVVDASIFPLLPPGHPQSTIYALAEKIADDIRQGR